MFKSFARIGLSAADHMDYSYVTKLTIPNPGLAGVFVDLNQSSGIPVYNPFVGDPLSFTPLVGSRNRGVNVGTFLTGRQKHLLRFQVLDVATAPSTNYLLDYLGFYPLLDGDDTDIQTMDNTQVLPRYVNGQGVRIVLIATAPMTLTAPLTIIYEDTNDVTRTVTFNTIPVTNIGACPTAQGTQGLASNASPFVELTGGSTGVKRIISAQFASGAGGFICLALVRPISMINTYELGVPVEQVFAIEKQNSPEIFPGAYLNFLIGRHTAVVTSFRSELIFINS